MQRTGPAESPHEWEIAYWRLDPYPHWEPIMQCPHSLVSIRMLQQLCDKQPHIQFRLRLRMVDPPTTLTFLSWYAGTLGG